MRVYIGFLCAALSVLCVAGALLSDVFLTVPNFLNILAATATIGLLAIGAAFVMGGGGIDLSVGSVMALSAVTAALAMSYVSVPLMLVAALATGVLVGAVNGILCGPLRLPPFIVTLGTLGIARGMALILTDGQPVYGLPESLVFLGQGRIFGIPVPILFFAGAFLLAHFVLNGTVFGRHVLAIGDHEGAARKAALRVDNIKIKLYCLSGALAALAGILFMARVNVADPSAGITYELTAITTAIVGGTALTGGRTSVAGAVLGALLMGVLQNILTLIDVPAYYQQVAVGLVLIAAVSLHRYGNVHASKD